MIVSQKAFHSDLISFFLGKSYFLVYLRVLYTNIGQVNSSKLTTIDSFLGWVNSTYHSLERLFESKIVVFWCNQTKCWELLFERLKSSFESFRWSSAQSTDIHRVSLILKVFNNSSSDSSLFWVET